MLTNAAITIFNRFPDRANRGFVYIPHVIPDVWFHAAKKVTADQGGLTSNPVYKIRIPFPRPDWISPEEYLKQENPRGSFTVKDKDLFLVGIWSGEKTVKGIEDIKKQFSGTVGVILNHSENFFGSSKHIRIEGGD